MKKKIIMFVMLLFSLFAYSQVGIGIAQPENHAVLDVSSTTKGMLVPRVTTVQRNKILSDGTSTTSNPAVNGLLVYNLDTDCFNYWSEKKSTWISMCQTQATTPVDDPTTTDAVYTIDCSQFPAADTNSYSVGTSTSGNTIKFNVNVTKTGKYDIVIYSINGIFYSASGNFTYTGVNSVIVGNATGTPSAMPINFTVVGNGKSVCNYTKNSGNTGGGNSNGNAIYSLADCSVSVYGNYTVATTLTSSNYLTARLNITSPGKLRLVSEDKNGILFDSGALNITSTGSQEIILKSLTATSGKFPMTSEEISRGGNGSSNQTANYTITNSLTGIPLSCKATIDVKPRTWQSFANTASDGFISGGLHTGANNGMINLEMQNNFTFQILGIGGYYKLWARNISGTNFNYSILSRSSIDIPASASLTYSSSLGNNSRVGSLDVYLQPGNREPSTFGEIGAHAGPLAALASENSETGMNITLGNITDSSKWFNNLGTKVYKYRLIFNTKDYRGSGTNMAIVLYGIYDTNAGVNNFDPGDLSVRGGNPQDTYWP